MAQTGYSVLSLYYSATASATPTAGNLVAGELALNTNDGRLFYKDSSGVVQTLASKATSSGVFTSVTDSGLTSGRVTYATTGGLLTDSANLQFDGNNLGIGGTQSYSGYRTLLVQGTNVSNGGVIQIQNSDSSVQSYWINTSALVNFGSVTSTPVGFITGNTERMRITSAGNVGIGTSSPNRPLTVNGTGVFGGVFGTSASVLIGNNGSVGYVQSVDAAGSANYPLAFFGASEYARFDTSGNLGLGVTPSAWVSGDTIFQIKSGTSYASLWGRSGSLRSITNAYYDGTNYKYASSSYAPASFQVENTGQFTWNNAPTGIAGNNVTFTQAMTLDNSGNLSLGTTPNANIRTLIQGADTSSSKYALTVYNSTPTTIMQLRNDGYFMVNNNAMILDTSGNLGLGTSSPVAIAAGYTTLDIRGTTGSGQRWGGATHNASIYSDTDRTQLATQSAKPLVFGTNATEAMRINSSGNLRLGTTTDLISANERFTIDAGANYGQVIKTTAGTTAYPQVIWNAATTGDDLFVSFATETSYTIRGAITYNRTGGLTVYGTTSDYRAKDIIGDISNSGEVIDSVPVYMGKMKGATVERPMFIAHETPEYAHIGEKDAVDADGNPVYQQMDASSLVPIMWAEIQSLRKRVALLESN